MSRRFVPVTLGAPDSVSLNLPAFQVTDAWFPPDLYLSAHEHAQANVAVMLDGSFDLAMDGRNYECPTGSAFTEPAGERHANRIGPTGAHVLVIQPGRGSDEALRPFRNLIQEAHYTPASAAVRLGLAISHELRFADEFTPLAVEGLSLEMLATLARGMRPETSVRPPAWLHRVEQLLRARSRESVRMSTLASEVDVHPVHLARTFRRHFGVSIAAYLRQLRIEWAAREMVTQAHESLASIALRAGFADQSHFTRVFREHTGETPARYRASRVAD